MTGVRVSISGQDAALQALAGYIARAEHPRGMFEQIGEALLLSTQMRFEHGQAPDGSPWPPSLRALAEGGRTLIDSERLKRSLAYVASDESLEFGSNSLYAAIHQFGGTITAKTEGGLRFRIGGQWVTKQQVRIPARPFIGLDDDDAVEVVAIAEDWIAGEEARA